MLALNLAAPVTQPGIALLQETSSIFGQFGLQRCHPVAAHPGQQNKGYLA
jgi:hypothetical protein